MKRAEIMFLALSLSMVLFPGTGYAAVETPESDLSQDPVIVTAQKRAEDVRTIPASITVLDETLIEDARIRGMEGIAAFTPGLEFNNAGSRRQAYTVMRGIKNVFNQASAMGYYVDGVSYSKSYMLDFPLFDIKRIEVLKGPQGTLYGRNAMSGVINVVTAEPDNEYRSEVRLNFGSDDLTECQGFLRAPIVEDTLFMGLSGHLGQRDGYMENDTLAGGDEGRYIEGGAGRLKLRYLPSDRLDMTLTLDGQAHDEGAFPYRRTSRNSFVKKGMLEADDRYHYSHDFNGSAENDFWGASLNGTYRLPFGTLTSVTGYRDFFMDEFFDADFSPLDQIRQNYIQEDKSFSQEFRLASTESQAPFQWLGGLYFFKDETETRNTQYYGADIAKAGSSESISDGSNKGAAVFGQGTLRFLEDFDLTLGLRYEYEDAEMKWAQTSVSGGGSTVHQSFPSASDDFHVLLPKISLAWHLSDSHMVYATFAGGHRGGGFNRLAPEGRKAYDEESSRLYEIGSKHSLWHQKLTLNLAGFYMDIQDEQIHQYDTGLKIPYIVNAAESHCMGLEAEMRITPVRGLDINAALTFLEAEYDRFFDAMTGKDYAGNQVFNLPEISGNIGVQYRRKLVGQWCFMGRMDASLFGSRYLDNANEVKENPYALVNAKIGIEGEHLDVYFWSDNLFDRHYIVHENTGKGLANDGAPRAAGISVSYRF